MLPLRRPGWPLADFSVGGACHRGCAHIHCGRCAGTGLMVRRHRAKAWSALTCVGWHCDASSEERTAALTETVRVFVSLRERVRSAHVGTVCSAYSAQEGQGLSDLPHSSLVIKTLLGSAL